MPWLAIGVHIFVLLAWHRLFLWMASLLCIVWNSHLPVKCADIPDLSSWGVPSPLESAVFGWWRVVVCFFVGHTPMPILFLHYHISINQLPRIQFFTAVFSRISITRAPIMNFLYDPHGVWGTHSKFEIFPCEMSGECGTDVWCI
jgi:hypothetical protein